MNNIKLTIHTPGDKKAVEVNFETLTASTSYAIPYRFAMADIANKADMQASGKLRHKNESSAIGGGIKLPRTEKLILLVKGNSEVANLSIGGAVYKLEGGSKMFEVDMFDFGRAINEEGFVEVKCDKQIEVAFIARF